MPDSAERWWFRSCLAALFAGLLVYSQTLAFSWDEGFHLLAAQLIRSGKRPYLDFCFPQTPLNAYVNAAWMNLFGDTWRAAHVLATFWVAAAAYLTGDFLLTRFPVTRWRLALALAGAASVALHSQVVLFGTIGQSYGICLFLSVAAFRLAVVAVERNSALWAAGAGGMAGAAAASSLLTAPVAPVLLLWLLFRNRAGSRWGKLPAFLIAAAIPFLPVLRLFLLGRQQTLFNVLQYQLLFRRVKWAGATGQDISALSSWIDSAQGLSLVLLGAAGAWFLWRKREWSRERRGEFQLALWMAVAIALELATAHPTFERYFLLVVPFIAIPAMAGLYLIGSQLAGADRPLPAAVLIIVLFALGLGRAIYEDRDSYSWHDCEKIALQIDKVTPRGAPIWTDELFFFLTRRIPADGMQFAYAHDLDLPPAQAAALHIVPLAELHRRSLTGTYQTIAACADGDDTEKLELASVYHQKENIRDCPIYWDWSGPK